MLMPSFLQEQPRPSFEYPLFPPDIVVENLGEIRLFEEVVVYPQPCGTGAKREFPKPPADHIVHVSALVLKCRALENKLFSIQKFHQIRHPLSLHVPDRHATVIQIIDAVRSPVDEPLIGMHLVYVKRVLEQNI